MGTFLSKPKFEKHSTGENGEHLAYGASSMQGWRASQEDAHNSIVSFDAGKSLFAVYDGQGGHKVAEYCSLYLPNYIKQNPDYKSGNYEKALEESFISFDTTLVERKVVDQLKQIKNPDKKEEDEQEINHLGEEATMPIEEVISKDSSDTESEPAKALHPLIAGFPLIAGLKKKEENRVKEGNGEETENGSPEGREKENKDEDEEDEEEEEDTVMADFTKEPGNVSGCTAVVALLAGSKLLVANAGDSRCVVCRDSIAVEMSLDHKPKDEPELKRIKAAGG